MCGNLSNQLFPNIKSFCTRNRFIMDLSKYNLSKLFNYQIKAHFIIGKLGWCDVLKEFFFNLCVSNLDLYLKKNGNKQNRICFVKISPIERPDIVKMLHDVQTTVEDRRYDELLNTYKRKIDLLRFVQIVIHSAKWYTTIRRCSYNMRETFLTLATVFKFYDIEKYLSKEPSFLNYKLWVLFYDALPVENFISQYAQKLGAKTATLQHGIMLAPRDVKPLNMDFAGLEFESFTSDFFLVWNEFTKHEALKSGIKDEQIRVLGIAKCLYAPHIQRHEHNNQIGVILDGKFEDENNEPMIRLVNGFCERHSMKCVLRYHPNYDGTEFDYVMIRGITQKYEKNKSLTDFLSEVDFCVLANSTVLFELENYNVPFVRYSTGNDKDKYRDYTCGTFNDSVSLEKSYQQMKKKSMVKQQSTEIQYEKFFQSFLG